MRRWAAVLGIVAFCALLLGTAALLRPPSCNNEGCVEVNGVPVTRVRYAGAVEPMAGFAERHPEAQYSSVAALSARVGYVWAFATEEEADAFNTALLVLETNCWVDACISPSPKP